MVRADDGQDRSVSSVAEPDVTPPLPPAGFRDRARVTVKLIRANPTGRIVLKSIVAVLGAIVVLVGLALIPLPGPGWLIVIGGLAIWAVEFHWARRLLEFTRRHVRSWTRWVGRQALPLRMLIGTAGIVFVSAVVYLSLKVGLGIDVIAEITRYVATQ